MSRRSLEVIPHDEDQDLFQAAKRERDGRVVTRILSIGHLLRGNTVPTTSQIFGISEAQLRRWVHRYNSKGLAGLHDLPRSGRPTLLEANQTSSFTNRLKQGPDAKQGLSAYRGCDIQDLLQEEFDATYTLSGTYALLHRLGYSSLVPRPKHPKSDTNTQEAFKKNWQRI